MLTVPKLYLNKKFKNKLKYNLKINTIQQNAFEEVTNRLLKVEDSLSFFNIMQDTQKKKIV